VCFTGGQKSSWKSTTTRTGTNGGIVPVVNCNGKGRFDQESMLLIIVVSTLVDYDDRVWGMPPRKQA